MRTIVFGPRPWILSRLSMEGRYFFSNSACKESFPSLNNSCMFCSMPLPIPGIEMFPSRAAKLVLEVSQDLSRKRTNGHTSRLLTHPRKLRRSFGDVGGLRPLLSLGNFELHLIALLKTLVAFRGDCAVMHKN